jgi:hypothetical protein
MPDRAIREQVAGCVDEMRQAASAQPGTGACAVATGMTLWDGLEEFVQLRTRLDGCLSGAALARARAAGRILGTT